MSKKIEFIKYVEELMKNTDIEMNDDAKYYWESFKTVEEKEKPAFTDNGKLILQYLKEHLEIEKWKSKDIAEGLFVSSRTVAGAMRKLVTDGYVEKVGQDPSIYIVTEKGKVVEF